MHCGYLGVPFITLLTKPLRRSRHLFFPRLAALAQQGELLAQGQRAPALSSAAGNAAPTRSRVEVLGAGSIEGG